MLLVQRMDSTATTYRKHGTRGFVCGILLNHDDVTAALRA